jgi:MFS family permease
VCLVFLYAKSVMLTGGAAAALELGALFGALASGILADRYSRRHSISSACSELPKCLVISRVLTLNLKLYSASVRYYNVSPHHSMPSSLDVLLAD